MIKLRVNRAGARAITLVAVTATAVLPGVANGHGPEPAQAARGPRLGLSFAVRRVSGRVSVHPRGARSFRAVRGAVTLKDGGELETAHGVAAVTVALPSGASDTALVSEGRARVTQSRGGAVLFTLSAPLTGCAHAAAALYHSRHTTRSRQLLVAEHGGEWDTQGRYVATSVEGTRWLTRDECTRSTVTTSEGAVTVHDLIHHTTTIVSASQSYTAAAAPPGAIGARFLDTLKPSSEGGTLTPGIVQINGTTYPHGLQMDVGLAQETDEATYAIPAGAKTFSAIVGNDDNQTNQFWEGITLLYEVFVDGRRVASAHAQGHTAEPLPTVPVAGAKTLRLLVTNLGDSPGATRADWAEPVLR